MMWKPPLTCNILQQNSAVNPFQGQATPPEGFNESQVQVYVVLNRLLSVDDNSYSFKGNSFLPSDPH